MYMMMNDMNDEWWWMNKYNEWINEWWINDEWMNDDESMDDDDDDDDKWINDMNDSMNDG